MFEVADGLLFQTVVKFENRLGGTSAKLVSAAGVHNTQPETVTY